MITKAWAKRAVAGSILALALPLAACSDVNQALDTASGAVDKAGSALGKAQACSEALGIVTSFNPEELSPEQIQQQAGKKAQQLRELGDKVSDASVQDALFAVADGYVSLEKRQAQQLENVNGWIQNNIDKIETLKKVCL